MACSIKQNYAIHAKLNRCLATIKQPVLEKHKKKSTMHSCPYRHELSTHASMCNKIHFMCTLWALSHGVWIRFVFRISFEFHWHTGSTQAEQSKAKQSTWNIRPANLCWHKNKTKAHTHARRHRHWHQQQLWVSEYDSIDKTRTRTRHFCEEEEKNVQTRTERNRIDKKQKQHQYFRYLCCVVLCAGAMPIGCLLCVKFLSLYSFRIFPCACMSLSHSVCECGCVFSQRCDFYFFLVFVSNTKLLFCVCFLLVYFLDNRIESFEFFNNLLHKFHVLICCQSLVGSAENSRKLVDLWFSIVVGKPDTILSLHLTTDIVIECIKSVVKTGTQTCI